MSTGGWAKLRKQQQQQSTQNPSEYDGAHEGHKYKNRISSKQQLTAAAHSHDAHIIQNTIGTASSPTISTVGPFSPPPTGDPMFPVDQGNIKASKLLQILRRWKALSARQVASRSHPSATSSTSCLRLHLAPLSCISFSSFELYSDHEEEANEDDFANDVVNIHSDSSLKSTNIPLSPLLNADGASSRQTAEPQSSRQSRMKNTECQGKDKISSGEETIRPPACRTLSCPKLRSPLSSCTASPIRMYSDSHEEEELECLQPKKEDSGRGTSKLRRSSSSPLRWHNVSKQPTTPKGYIALYVGEERRRFLVKANMINHPLFSVLLEKAKEEFGFEQKGALNIPCEIAFFQHILFLVESKLSHQIS